jgi:hypothetical protein
VAIFHGPFPSLFLFELVLIQFFTIAPKPDEMVARPILSLRECVGDQVRTLIVAKFLVIAGPSQPDEARVSAESQKTGRPLVLFVVAS